MDQFLKSLLGKARPGLYHIWNYSPQIYKPDIINSRLDLAENEFDIGYSWVMKTLKCKSDVCRCKKDLLLNLIEGLKRLMKKQKVPYTSCTNLNILIHCAEVEFTDEMK